MNGSAHEAKQTSGAKENISRRLVVEGFWL
jgi:hypothetical protein